MNLLDFRVPYPSAQRLLNAGLMLAALSGCLLPQDNQVLPDLPPPRNTPPVIEDQQVKPPGTGLTLKVGTGCTPQATVFEVPVKDEDFDPVRGAYTDKISSVWIVDPSGIQPGFSGTPAPAFSRGDTRFLKNPPQLLSAGSALTVPGDHVLQVIVADGDLEGIGIPVPVPKPLPDGGIIEDPTYTDSYQWNVTTEQGVCP